MLAFFSVHLKQLREAKKLTQTQVANYVGVSRSVISAYENDMRYPSYSLWNSPHGTKRLQLLAVCVPPTVDFDLIPINNAAFILQRCGMSHKNTPSRKTII